MLNNAIMTEMTNTSAGVFIKARKNLIVWWRQKSWIWKKEDCKKVYFLKFQYRLKGQLIGCVREQENCL